ncbi:MAG: HAMP domain-containing histidine kinase [Candidatus Aminicenantes bacterium]|nr:MAG: HAMP domain-containing histidine kinase [Candidatus Aminicenantes bacterium]
MLQKSLIVKLIFCITVVLILAIGIFAFVNINLQRKYIFEGIRQNAVQLSQTIEKSIKYDMLTARNDYIQRTIEDIGKQEGIVNVRIFDKEGKIIAADSVEEVGKFIDKRAEACFTCHSDKVPLKRLSSQSRTRIFKAESGYRVLGVVNPLYNEPECYNSACHFHPEEQNVLGVMDILISLANFDQQILTGRKQIIIYLIFSFLFISGGISLFIFLFVRAPIRKLIVGTQKIAEGDLNYRIGSYSSDEIGKLSKSFDEMTARLKKSREEIEQWNLKLKNEIKKATKKLVQTNEKLNDANKKLRALDDMKSDFMRRIEHGSRSHLAVIKSCLSLVLGEYTSELDDQQKDLINTAERRSVTMLELLDDFLLLSYRKSALGVYHMEPVQLADFLKKMVVDIQAQSKKKNIKIDIQIPLQFPQVWADRAGLNEIFSNLLNNAVKYTGENSEITVSAKQRGDFVEISVADTGIGIAPEDISKIFNEFYRSPNAKSYKVEGTGLGLAIVKEIVETHHGSISVNSELGKGSIFTIKLPIGHNKPTKI